MTQNHIYRYGYEDGNKGLEAKYMLMDKTLYVRITGSNHWSDYLFNFMAWPRVRPFGWQPFKLHGPWWYMARELHKHLMREICGLDITHIEVIGHSMGGAVAAILGLYLPTLAKRVITTVNAPKIGNRAAMWALRRSGADIHVLYDGGDIVHYLPLLYANYPLRSRREYARTKGIEKAHVNMPPEWGVFPI